jgi:hypothetical protein
MFSIAIRKKLVRKLQRPLRPKELRDNAVEWMNGTGYKSVPNFIAALEDENIIQMHTVESQNGKKIPIYCSRPWAEVDVYELPVAAIPNGYFCDLTAVYHHSLTNQIPNAVYWCHENLAPRKRGGAENLSNARIRSAFLKPHRYTRFVIPHRAHDILVVAGTRGPSHGVEEVRHQHSPCPVGSRVTSLERTLIDAVVSPHYSGGLTSLFEYFRAARKRLNVTRMLDIYQKLDFVYPYAQPLGFMLDHCGMKDEAEKVRIAYPPRQRFYIDHGAKSTWIYNERWMLSHPKGFLDED